MKSLRISSISNTSYVKETDEVILVSNGLSSECLNDETPANIFYYCNIKKLGENHLILKRLNLFFFTLIINDLPVCRSTCAHCASFKIFYIQPKKVQ